MRTWLLAVLVLAVLFAGCTGSAPPANGTNVSGTLNASPVANASVSPANTTPADPIVVFETTKGNFTAKIYVNEAPITGGNFMKLVRSGFYNNLTFHRVIPGFVAQGGDPLGTGAGGSGTTIPQEIIPGLTHTYGAMAMADAGPGTASSQFYVVLNVAACAQLDGRYAVFGQVQGDGMSVVNALNPGEPPANPDRMLRVYEQKS